MRVQIRLSDPLLREHVAQLVRETRALVGWSQAELAARAGTSQSRVSRLERGETNDLDTALLAGVLRAFGLQGTFEVSSMGLDDRRAQHAPIHGLILGDVARRLRRWGWATATEVEIPGRDGAPRGWIDLLAHREADAAGLLGEIKGDIPDPGALQRQVGFYEREANAAMRRLGWRPGGITRLVLALDTAQVHATLRAHAPLMRADFPGEVPDLLGWLRTNGAPTPPPTIALVDPLARADRWLRRPPFTDRRTPAAYAAYAEAAEALTRPRTNRGRPR